MKPRSSARRPLCWLGGKEPGRSPQVRASSGTGVPSGWRVRIAARGRAAAYGHRPRLSCASASSVRREASGMEHLSEALRDRVPL